MTKILNYLRDFGKRVSRWFGEIVSLSQESDVFVAILIVLVAFASFGLGRLSKISNSREPVTIENISERSGGEAEKTDKNELQAGSEKGNFVASKNGTKYYLPWCGGVGRISEVNKVWFNTKEEAAAAGLAPAANCPGI